MDIHEQYCLTCHTKYKPIMTYLEWLRITAKNYKALEVDDE